nr:hypothetical protein [Pseudomonas mangiferae]
MQRLDEGYSLFACAFQTLALPIQADPHAVAAHCDGPLAGDEISQTRRRAAADQYSGFTFDDWLFSMVVPHQVADAGGGEPTDEYAGLALQDGAFGLFVQGGIAHARSGLTHGGSSLISV